jgi:16S rRNA (guanine(966)-N(2))-methyltransferase RsmD
MSAEALCRGASQVVAIEQWGRACGIIRQNLETVANDEQSFEILRGDVVKQLHALQGRQFDRIYFDPPYASDLYQPVIEAIAHWATLWDTESLLCVNGELAVEHDRDRPPHLATIDDPPKTLPLEICRQKVYGNTAVTFYRLVTD